MEVDDLEDLQDEQHWIGSFEHQNEKNCQSKPSQSFSKRSNRRGWLNDFRRNIVVRWERCLCCRCLDDVTTVISYGIWLQYVQDYRNFVKTIWRLILHLPIGCRVECLLCDTDCRVDVDSEGCRVDPDGIPWIAVGRDALESDVNNWLDLADVQNNLSVECQDAIQLIVLVECLEGVCERVDIALRSAARTGLTYQIGITVVVGGAFADAIVVVEEGTHTSYAVRSRYGTGCTFWGTIVARNLVGHEVCSVGACSNTGTIVVECQGGAALLDAEIIAEKIAWVAAEAIGGIGAIVAAIDTELTSLGDGRGKIVYRTVLDAILGCVQTVVV